MRLSVKIENQKQPLPILKQQSSSRPGMAKDYDLIPEPMKKIAGAMEKQFLQLMLKQMEKTTGSEQEGQAMDYYKSLNVDEKAKALMEKNEGLGMQKMILDQIYPESRRTEFAYKNYLRQQDRIKKNHPHYGIKSYSESDKEISRN